MRATRRGAPRAAALRGAVPDRALSAPLRAPIVVSLDPSAPPPWRSTVSAPRPAALQVQLMCKEAERPLTIEFSTVWPPRTYEPSVAAIPLPQSKAAKKKREPLEAVNEAPMEGASAEIELE